MQIIRVIASPGGDLSFGRNQAGVGLEGCPSVTYGDYFQALEAFLTGEDQAPLRAALADRGEVGAIERLVLRAEKHGALYHPASVEVAWDGGRARYCVNVAVEPVGGACLEQEAGLLAGLRARFTPEFLPCPYAAGRVGSFWLLLEAWFEGFHEFHQDGTGRVRLWDFELGERLLSGEQSLALYREAARILTRYFGGTSGERIGPWHHAAGDFVARVDSRGVTVRLITVRGHGSAGDFSQAGPMAGRLALLSFFLTLTMAMRLDRVDGVGQAVLAGEDVAEAAVAGFADALAEREDTRGEAAGMLEFLASFAPQELAEAAVRLAEPFAPGEAGLVEAAWPGHAAAVARALATWRPSD
jgi:hypothetical protein